MNHIVFIRPPVDNLKTPFKRQRQPRSIDINRTVRNAGCACARLTWLMNTSWRQGSAAMKLSFRPHPAENITYVVNSANDFQGKPHHYELL